MPRIYEEQPVSSPGVWNRLEYRPLEGFVFAVTPFNFTAIGGNLPTSAGADGRHGRLEAGVDRGLLRVLHDAAARGGGLPAGRDQPRLRPRRRDRRPRPRERDLAGRPLHRLDARSSTSMWKTIGQNIERYRNYPRIVGETGGKDFIVAHPSADVEAVATAILRGSFEYQGQKCSAASRVYVPANLWPELRERLVEEVGDAQDGRRHRLRELHGRRDRREVVRDAEGGDRARRARTRPRWSQAAAPTTPTASSSSRP